MPLAIAARPALHSSVRPSCRLRPGAIVPGLALGLALSLAACAEQPGSLPVPPLVSAQSPPGTGMVNDASEPQPLGSLPRGAANLGAAPGAMHPSYFARAFRL